MTWKPIQLGHIISGPKAYKYLIDTDYDWEYRLCHIKATADYSAFYWIHPLETIYLGPTLEKAVEALEKIHVDEGCRSITSPVPFSELTSDEISF